MTNQERNYISKMKALSLKIITNEGYEVSIIEYFDAYNCTIVFEYNGVKMYNMQFNHVKSGQLKNPYHKGNEGVGFMGEGVYSMKLHKKAYNAWSNMLTRGYNKKYKNERTTYKDVIVCDEWHNFQNFAKWFEENYTEGFHLDKDIICEECKIYSPATCVFVPRDINTLLIKRNKMRGKLPIGVNFHKTHSVFQVNINQYGKTLYIGSFKTKEEAFEAYKTAKEEYIKEVADKWKDLISETAYKAMIDYKVEIND